MKKNKSHYPLSNPSMPRGCSAPLCWTCSGWRKLCLKISVWLSECSHWHWWFSWILTGYPIISSDNCPAHLWKKTHKPNNKCTFWNIEHPGMHLHCVTKYIYSSTVLRYNFDVFVNYSSISILCYFILFHHISERKMLSFSLNYIYFLLELYLLVTFQINMLLTKHMISLWDMITLPKIVVKISSNLTSNSLKVQLNTSKIVI